MRSLFHTCNCALLITVRSSPRKADELIVPPQLAAPLFKATVLHVDGPSAPGIAPVSEVSLPTQATEQKLTKQLVQSYFHLLDNLICSNAKS